MPRSSLIVLWAGLIAVGVWFMFQSMGVRAEFARLEFTARQDAVAATQDLKSTLEGRLTEAMSEGGPLSSMEVCASVAQELTQSLADEHGIQLRRTALRVRNPANAPDRFERGWMEKAALGSTFDNPIQPLSVRVTREDYVSQLEHFAPIYLAANCLVCHGSPEQIPADVQAFLNERYPADRARGFAAGEFRGIVSIRIPLILDEIP